MSRSAARAGGERRAGGAGRRMRRAAFALLGAVLLAGCASVEPLPSEPLSGQDGTGRVHQGRDEPSGAEGAAPSGGQGTEGGGSLFQVVRSSEATGRLLRSDLFPMRPERIEWAVIRENGRAFARLAEAPRRDVTVAATTERGAAVKVDEGKDRTLFLVPADDGSVVMVATESHADAALSLFTPGLLMAPAELAAGSPVEATVQMRVVSLPDGTRERDTGHGWRRTTLAREDVIRTPLGELTCMRVDVDFDANLGIAEAKVRSQRWILPGTGPVAERWRQRITVLGLLPSQVERTMVRVTPVDPPGSSAAAASPAAVR